MVSEPESCPKLNRANRLANPRMSNKGVEPRLRGDILCSRYFIFKSIQVFFTYGSSIAFRGQTERDLVGFRMSVVFEFMFNLLWKQKIRWKFLLFIYLLILIWLILQENLVELYAFNGLSPTLPLFVFFGCLYHLVGIGTWNSQKSYAFNNIIFFFFTKFKIN